MGPVNSHLTYLICCKIREQPVSEDTVECSSSDVITWWGESSWLYMKGKGESLLRKNTVEGKTHLYYIARSQFASLMLIEGNSSLRCVIAIWTFHNLQVLAYSAWDLWIVYYFKARGLPFLMNPEDIKLKQRGNLNMASNINAWLMRRWVFYKAYFCLNRKASIVILKWYMIKRSLTDNANACAYWNFI